MRQEVKRGGPSFARACFLILLSSFCSACGGGGTSILPTSAGVPAPAATQFAKTQSATMQSENPKSSDSFVDSIGINTHLHYTDTAYATAWSQVESLLSSSGIRHVRDGLIDTTWQTYYDHLNALGSLGIHGDYITSVGQSGSLIASYPSRVSQSFESYEGPNEYDWSGDPNWIRNLTSFQSLLHTTVQGNASIAAYPIYGPALTSENSYVSVGSLTSMLSDGNIHSYLAGRNPGTAGWGGTDTYGTYACLSYDLALGNVESGGKPVVVTETGYQDQSGAQNRVPAGVKSRYTLRTVLENWNAGIPRTYLYELLDEGGQSYGLLDGAANPKPAYTALKTLIGLLADPGGAFSTSSLTYEVDAVSSVHHMLLQKRDGSYRLLLWEEVPAWNPATNTALTVTPQNVVLTFASAPSAISAVSIDDDGNANPVTLSGSPAAGEIFQVDDHVTVMTVKI